MRKIILINLLIIITGITALGSAVIYKHYREVNATPLPTKSGYLPPQNIDEQTIEILVNEERKKNGLSGLIHSEILCEYAENRSLEIRTNYSHDGFYISAYGFQKDHNLTSVGENLSKGFQYNGNLVMSWMSSPTHKANILNPHFTHTCVKCDSKYCVQIFAEPSPTNP